MFGHRKKPAECSDEDLMRLLQREATHFGRHPAGALDELYQRYSVALLRYFYRMVWKDREKAQDMLHDLFVKVIEHASGFDTNKSFKTWIYSISYNMCKNEYRKFQQHKTANESLTITDYVESGIELKLDDENFRQRLELLLETLSEDDKNLFVLRYENDMPFHELAVVLGMPEGTVKSRMFYLKKKLAQELYTFKVINR